MSRGVTSLGESLESLGSHTFVLSDITDSYDISPESHSRISSAIVLVSSLTSAGIGFSRSRGLNPIS